MRVVLGFKSHSGWAAMVAVGAQGNGFEIIDRRRIELIEEGELWAKQPYHAAENLETNKAREVVERGIESARRVALRQMRGASACIRELKHDIVGCAVLVPSPMPDWSIDEIIAVHIRMHKAEGVLFPDALCRAADACNLPFFGSAEKDLESRAGQIFARSTDVINLLARLGRSVGPPWGKDQKAAALAAMIVLKQNQ